jgi:hypothetical protein
VPGFAEAGSQRIVADAVICGHPVAIAVSPGPTAQRSVPDATAVDHAPESNAPAPGTIGSSSR